jgi:hypothetical protein
MWKRHYDALFVYRDTHGTFDVSWEYSCTADDGTHLRLGPWLTVQRRKHATGELYEDRFELLDALTSDDYGDSKVRISCPAHHVSAT